VEAPHLYNDNNVLLASPLDIAVQKLLTVIDRDKTGFAIEDILGAAVCIYPGFSSAVALKALAYFSDIVKYNLSLATPNFLT